MNKPNYMNEPTINLYHGDCMEAKTKTGKTHTDETKKKMAAAKLGDRNPMKRKEVSAKRSETLIANGSFSGPNNHKWKGGFERYRGRGWHQQRLVRLGIDNNTCQECGATSSLIVHHIVADKENWDNSIDNLITLCRSCHNKTHRLAEKMRKAKNHA